MAKSIIKKTVHHTLKQSLNCIVWQELNETTLSKLQAQIQYDMAKIYSRLRINKRSRKPRKLTRKERALKNIRMRNYWNIVCQNLVHDGKISGAKIKSCKHGIIEYVYIPLSIPRDLVVNINSFNSLDDEKSV